MAAKTSQRIDKWLWHARFARTRTAAQRLAVSGHIRINKQKVNSPSRQVRPGDVLTLALGRTVVVLTILALAARRGSADLAQTLYIQHEPEASSLRTQSRRLAAQEVATAGVPNAGPRPEGRPDKRERRRAAVLKRHADDI